MPLSSSQSEKKLADFAQRKLRGKIPELEKALEGHLTEHHQFMLRQLWKQLTQEEELITELDARIEGKCAPARLRSSVSTRSRASSACRRGGAGRSRSQYEAVSQPCALSLVGRDVSRQ